MRILLTGATGVIGRRLIPLLKAAGHEVTAVSRSSAGAERIRRQGATPINLDLFDQSAVSRVVAGHDALINMATHIPSSQWQIFLPWAWQENDRLRREASAILVDACIANGVSRFVQESFAPVYPDCGDRWIDESTPIQPVRYNRSVADAEASANRFAAEGTAVVLRFGGFYGPDADQTGIMMQSIKKGWAPLPGPANAFISSVSHDDAAAAVAAALALPSGVYNVVDDDPVTHREFFDSIAAALAVPPPKILPAWTTVLLGSLGAMLSRSIRISNRKIRSASGWTPIYRSVREGWPAVVAQLQIEPRQFPDADARHQRVH